MQDYIPTQVIVLAFTDKEVHHRLSPKRIPIKKRLGFQEGSEGKGGAVSLIPLLLLLLSLSALRTN